ncbi:MAG: sodium:proton antiporter [Spirochaetales bacterium]|nr:sodium:proton antiporter [Spirochaetales bacterium]
MADKILFIAAGISLLSIFIALLRFIKGPSVLDRVVAFDVISIIAISVICILAFLLRRFIYVDVALVYGLLSFLGVLVVARYYERGL